MKNFSLFLAGITCLFVTTPSFASFFEVCNVTAKVASLEELSVFGKGSVSVPSGVNPDGKEVYSFVKLLTLEVLDVEAQGGHTDCKRMLDNNHKVILDSKDILAGTKIGDQLKLTRTTQNGMTPNGVAYGQTWKLQ